MVHCLDMQSSGSFLQLCCLTFVLIKDSWIWNCGLFLWQQDFQIVVSSDLNSKFTTFSSPKELTYKNRNSFKSKELVDRIVKDLGMNWKQFKILTQKRTDKEYVRNKHLCCMGKVILKMLASVLPILFY